MSETSFFLFPSPFFSYNTENEIGQVHGGVAGRQVPNLTSVLACRPSRDRETASGNHSRGVGQVHQRKSRHRAYRPSRRVFEYERARSSCQAGARTWSHTKVLGGGKEAIFVVQV